MIKRLKIERKIKDNVFKAKIGTVNRITPSTVYVTGKAYISPVDVLETYDELIDSLGANFRSILKKYTKDNSNLNKNFILNLEIPKNSLKYGKNTYMFFQLFFSQKPVDGKYLTIDSLKKVTEDDILEVLKTMENTICDSGFTIHEKRKS